MADNQTTIAELKQKLIKFRDERNWNQFHDPKNLAEAISIEANELLELFLWKSKEEILKKLENQEYLEKIKQELSDVLAFVLNFANTLDIDISESLLKKIDDNGKKYPIDKSKDNANKYTEL